MHITQHESSSNWYISLTSTFSMCCIVEKYSAWRIFGELNVRKAQTKFLYSFCRQSTIEIFLTLTFMIFSLILAILGLVYLVYSGLCLYRWFHT